MLKRLCQVSTGLHRRSSEEGFNSEEVLNSSRNSDHQRELYWKVLHEEWKPKTLRYENRTKFQPVSHT